MVTSTPSFTVFRFSSRALPEQGRGKAIEALHERGLLPATKFTPLGEAVPHVEFSNRSMSGLRILTGTYAGIRREGVPLGGDHLYFLHDPCGNEFGEPAREGNGPKQWGCSADDR